MECVCVDRVLDDSAFRGVFFYPEEGLHGDTIEDRGTEKWTVE